MKIGNIPKAWRWPEQEMDMAMRKVWTKLPSKFETLEDIYENGDQARPLLQAPAKIIEPSNTNFFFFFFECVTFIKWSLSGITLHN